MTLDATRVAFAVQGWPKTSQAPPLAWSVTVTVF